jgi:hypothetical protein
VLFLDDDDVLRPSAVEVLRSELQREPGALAVVGGRSTFGEVEIERLPHPRRRSVRNVRKDVLFGWAANQGNGVDVAEEHELWLRLVTRNSHPRVVLTPDLTVAIRTRAGGAAGEAQDEAATNARARFVIDAAAPRSAVRLLRAQRHVSQARRRRGPIAIWHACAATGLAPDLLVSPISGPVLVSALLRSARSLMNGPRGA